MNVYDFAPDLDLSKEDGDWICRYEQAAIEGE